MNDNWVATKFGGRWAVFDKATASYTFIGKGRKFCELKAKELNALDKAKREGRI